MLSLYTSTMGDWRHYLRLSIGGVKLVYDRACIVIRNGIEVLYLLCLLCFRNTTVVSNDLHLGSRSRKVILTSAYFPHDSNENSPLINFRKVMEHCMHRMFNSWWEQR